jgi:hypothetical protein
VRAGDGDLERHVACRSVRSLDELDLHRRRKIGTTRDATDQIVAEERREEIGEAAEVEVARLEAAAS